MIWTWIGLHWFMDDLLLTSRCVSPFGASSGSVPTWWKATLPCLGCSGCVQKCCGDSLLDPSGLNHHS